MRELTKSEINDVVGGGKKDVVEKVLKATVKVAKAVAVALLETSPGPSRYGSDGWRP